MRASTSLHFGFSANQIRTSGDIDQGAYTRERGEGMPKVPMNQMRDQVIGIYECAFGQDGSRIEQQ